MHGSFDDPKTDPALWQRLKRHAFSFGDGGYLADAVRDETGLTAEEAERTVGEYRRFLYLVATAGETLAPSRLVDRVWHLHMEDEVGYFDELCERVIGRRINHHRGRAAPFDDPAYAKTLAFYRAEFGEVPCWRVWPTPDKMLQPNLAVIGGFAVFAGGVVAFGNSAPILGVILMCLAAGAVFLFAKASPWPADAGSAGGCGGSSDGDGGCGGD